MNLDVLTGLIEEWGESHGILLNGQAMGQAIKTLEETTELIDAINRGDTADIKDAVGDVFVTLVMVCGVLKLDINECVELSYNEIKDRRGYLRSDGVFVKKV